MDPNKTQIGLPPARDPNRTRAIPGGAFQGGDPNRTMAIPGGASPMGDPLKTTAFQAVTPGKALAVSVVPGREAAMANGPAREQFLVELTAAAVAEGLGSGGGARTAINLCLVIDRSGSMEGTPLEYVKQACGFVVDMLTPNDVLSIVTFEETVDVLMAPQRVTDKGPIKDGLSRLMPGNTTNLHDGISVALQQVLGGTEGKRATRMVVLTDGDPTAGIKDFPSLTNLAGEIKAKGVSVTFLGFGPDYNEVLLAGRATRAGGTYRYIDQPSQIPDVFRGELDRLMTTVARNVSLSLKPARWVNLRAPAASTGTEVSVPLADLERGATITQVVDMEFPNHPQGWYRVAAGKVTYDDLLMGTPQSVEVDIVMEFTGDAARYSGAQDPRVNGAAQVALASKAVERTVMGLKTGQITAMGAVDELQKTQMLLVSEGRTAEAQEVTMALRAIQSGDAGAAEKTLMGTMLNLDQGKH